jgi:hypothetical protein
VRFDFLPHTNHAHTRRAEGRSLIDKAAGAATILELWMLTK